MNPVDVTRGTGPVILAMPHTGVHIPVEIEAKLNDTGLARADTDWHVDRLYEGLLPGASVIRATFHRYVIDANRAPSGASLYPGQNTTGLCPVIDFTGANIYCDGCEPDEAEIERRRLACHAPYHAALAAEIARVKDAHGRAILYDCHSIRSQIEYLFEGTLPDFNIGTNEGKTCSAEIEQAVFEICKSAKGYTSVLNGRFKGGWTTRHYGDPANNIHAIQMELAQKTYTEEEAPWGFCEERAQSLRAHLKEILGAIENASARRS